MAPKPQRELKLTKVIDERSTIRCVSGAEGMVRFEAWMDGSGKIVRYNMAFVHHLVCQVDNGRVLGYDNAHSFHERHFLGQASTAVFVSFAATLQHFLNEVDEMKAKH